MPWIIAGGALLGGVLSAGATSSAADTAAGATDRASQQQLQMFQQNKADLAPWMNEGQLALSQLAAYMGLPSSGMAPTGAPGPVSGAPGGFPMGAPGSPGIVPRPELPGAPGAAPAGGAGMLTADQIRAQLAPQFTSGPAPGVNPALIQQMQAGGVLPPSTVNNAGLDAAVQAALARQQHPAAAAPSAPGASGIPGVPGAGTPAAPGTFGPGALTQGFTPGTAAADPVLGLAQKQLAGTQTDPILPLTLQSLASTTSDPLLAMISKGFNFKQDPGYGFRLQQGLDAVKNQASALGGVNSGATLKSLNDYAQGQATSEYNNAFTRWMQQMGLMGSEAQNAFGRQATALGQVGDEYNANFNRQSTSLSQVSGSYMDAFNRWDTTLNNLFQRLSSMSGTGANAAGGVAGLGANAAANAGGLTAQAGALQTAGALGSGRSLSTGIENAVKAFQQGGGTFPGSSSPGAFTMPNSANMGLSLNSFAPSPTGFQSLFLQGGGAGNNALSGGQPAFDAGTIPLFSMG